MANGSQENRTFQVLASRLEVLDPGQIMQKLQAEQQVTGFWGTAPTGKPHIGYLVPLIKVAECIKAGIQVTILIADHYAYRINYDVSLEIVRHRAQYYTHLVTAVLRALGVPVSEIRIVRDSSFSTSAHYQRNLMRMCAVSRQDEVRAASHEAHGTAMVSPLLCPIRQALDEVYMGCDFQLGGLDQRDVFEYTDKSLPRIGHKPSAHLMTSIIPGLKSRKMSSSAPADTKIMFTDSSDTVDAKIASADRPIGNDLTGNAIMTMFEHIVFPFRGLSSLQIPLVEVCLVSGELKQYDDYNVLREDVLRGQVNTEDLGRVLARELNGMMEPVREQHAVSIEWRLAEQRGYDLVDMAGMRV